MADLSVADALALGSNRTFDNDGMFGNSWWVTILFLFMFANGGFGFGNGNLNQVTNDFLFTNLKNTIDAGFTQLTNQSFNTQKDILQGICSTNNTVQAVGNGIQRDIMGVQQSLCDGFYGVSAAINQSRFDAEKCCLAS